MDLEQAGYVIEISIVSDILKNYKWFANFFGRSIIKMYDSL